MSDRRAWLIADLLCVLVLVALVVFAQLTIRVALGLALGPAIATILGLRQSRDG